MKKILVLKKIPLYTGFVIASLMVIAAFVTAKSYTQLIAAIILYPLLAYFTLKIFPRKAPKALEFRIQAPEPTKEKVDVVDIDKRMFLKLIGATGLSFFLFSLLGRRAETLIFSRNLSPGLTALPDNDSSQTGGTSTSVMEGYRISEVDDGSPSYYGFVNKSGGWLIMREDLETNSFRYAKGDSHFPNNWSKRKNLKYDYYDSLF